MESPRYRCFQFKRGRGKSKLRRQRRCHPGRRKGGWKLEQPGRRPGKSFKGVNRTHTSRNPAVQRPARASAIRGYHWHLASSIVYWGELWGWGQKIELERSKEVGHRSSMWDNCQAL